MENQITQNNVPTTLNGQQVISNPQAFNVPQVDPNAYSNALTSSITALLPQVQQAQAGVNNAENQNTQGNNDLISLMSQLGGQTADTQQAENQVGLPTLNKELTDLRTLQSQQLGTYINNINQQQINKTGMFGDAVSNNMASINRQHGIDALLTSSLIQAKEGNITAAQATVDRAISAKYDPIKNAINVQNQIIKNNYELLSRADKKLADVKLQENKLEEKKLDKQIADETSMENMIIDAQAQQAPMSVIKNARAIIAKGGTPADVAVAIGQYSGAAAKAELLREQIKTEKAQRAKINSDMNTAKTSKAPEVKSINGVDSQWNGTSWVPVTTTGTPTVNEAQLKAFNSADALLKRIDDTKLKGNLPVGRGRLNGVALPGSSRADFIAQANNLTALLTLDNLKYLKGPTSDKDIIFLTNASTALNRNQSIGEYTKTLTDIRNTLLKYSPENQYVESIIPSIDSTGQAIQASPTNYWDSLK